MEASEVMMQSPFTLQLRYLQTLSEIATEHSSTILFPLPLDLVKPILDAASRSESRASSG
jgi:hypothetical protein